ncbi:MAK10-like protein [Tanacetum coccineum]
MKSDDTRFIEDQFLPSNIVEVGDDDALNVVFIIGKNSSILNAAKVLKSTSNWLKRLPVGSISTWEDLTTHFLAQFFPSRRIAKLQNDILMFQQHQGESLSEAWTCFKDLLQKVPHHGIDLWLHVNPATRRTIDQSADGKLCDKNAKESWALIEDLALYDNESWNDPRDFAKLVKTISLPRDVPNASDHCLIELENQVQRLMEAHLAPKSSVQVNKIASSCKICSGPHDSQYCMENTVQAFVDYASSHNNEVGGKSFATNQGPINFNEATHAWKYKLNFNWARTQPFTSPESGSFSTYGSNVQSKLERVLSNFDSHQEKRLSSLGTRLKQQQDELFNRINTLWKVVSDKIDNAPIHDIVKSPIAHVNVISHDHYENGAPPNKGIKSDRAYRNEKEVEEVGEWMEYEEPLDLVDMHDESIYESLIEKMSSCSLNFDFRIEKGDPSNLKIPCMIGHKFIDNAYIDLDSPINVMSLACYNTIRNQGEQGLITFTDEIKEVTYRTPYRDSEMDDLTSNGHDLLSFRVILSKDDYKRGCERASDLESGFYKDIDKLGPSYKEEIERINLDMSFEAGGSRTSEGGVTLYLIRRSLEVLRIFLWTILG